MTYRSINGIINAVINQNKFSLVQTVELFHLLFLDQLGRKLEKRNYILKGGCNLRFFFKSIRYSEDIDLDAVNMSKERVRKTVNKILVSTPFKEILQIHNLRIDYKSEPKQTETTQRWKFILVQTDTGKRINTKIEFSRRGRNGNSIFSPVDPLIVKKYGVTSILLNHYDLQSAYEQKLKALITRKSVQARDIFDANLLLNSGADPLIKAKKIIPDIDKAIENALSVKFDIFKSQVLAYIHPEYKNQYDAPDVWDNIVLGVVKAMEEGRADNKK
ncbi:MAG TPA: nucleotidyl transferase AbiEii/AbiGii toxin family protein [Spirochaetota bacterium]|nr:nucleotidyl transferase AbiEii/AbiGii toxin family protein [Spirochaetota bacterium]